MTKPTESRKPRTFSGSVSFVDPTHAQSRAMELIRADYEVFITYHKVDHPCELESLDKLITSLNEYRERLVRERE